MNLRQISGGLFLIFLGAVFLLINLGYLSWSFWWAAFTWWPLVLVVFGLGLLFGRRIPFTLVLLVLGIVLVVMSYLYPSRPLDFWGPMWWWGRQVEPIGDGASGTVTLDESLPAGVDAARVELSTAGARMNLDAGTDALLQGRIDYNRFRPEVRVDRSGREMRVKIDGSPPGRFGPWWPGRHGDGSDNWELHLHPAVTYDLDVNGGALNGTLDFSRLKVSRLRVSAGASDLRLVFGDTGAHSRVDVSAGASKVALVVPPSVGYRIETTGGVVKTNFGPSGFLQDGKPYTSDNYQTAATRLDIDISAGATEVRLERP